VRASVCLETQQGASYDQILCVARSAEAAGFDGVYLSDHYLKMGWKAGGDGGFPGPSDAWTTLAGLARDTATIRLGTLVNSATFRQPVPLAIIVAQVDAMSGGRAVLGLGAGWYVAEHEVQGIPFPPVAERFDRLEEQLAIITGFWATPPAGSFTFRGNHYAVVDSPGLPKPVQRPGPPIVMGGEGAKRTPVLAARYATEFNAPFVSASKAAVLYERVRRACEEIGRDPASLALSAGVIVCCGNDAAEVSRRAKAIGIDPVDPPAEAVCGTPDEVAERLDAWVQAGAGHVYLEIDDLSDTEHLGLIAETVIRRP
jgi:F420-dependent oxidoreductase-like protein